MKQKHLLAAALSAFLPGLGQLLLGQNGKAIFFLSAIIISMPVAAILTMTVILAPIGALLPIAVWLLSIFDILVDDWSKITEELDKEI